VTTAWIDTNVIVRFLSKDPPALSQRAARLMARAETGEITFRLSAIVVAEIVWVLRTVYALEPVVIATALSALLRADGIVVDGRDTLIEALDVMVERRVAFPDAFTAVSARQAGDPVCSFDADFKRLDVEILAS
jgi:predicted nucleic acid-binding protein